jgi:biotin operon repressor
MDTVTYEAIAATATLLQDYQNIPQELRKIAEYIAEPSHKRRMLAIAKLIERDVPNQLFGSRSLQALEILRLISAQSLSDEEIGVKIGRSPKTAKQVVGALKKGGVGIVEETARGYKIGSQGGRPAVARSVSKERTGRRSGMI